MLNNIRTKIITRFGYRNAIIIAAVADAVIYISIGVAIGLAI